MVARWIGRLLCVAALAAWSVWFAWRLTVPFAGLIGIAELGLEIAACAAAGFVTAGLWSAGAGAAATADSDVLFVDRFDAVLGLNPIVITDRAPGPDDTGEVARARHGVGVLDVRRRGRRSLAEIAGAVIAVEGIRRMLFVALLIIVLLSGRVPFERPPSGAIAALLGAQVALGVGHWCLSAGVIRPGDRLRWSMASVGAGFGDGTSRSGLPIRWATTMATIVVLNIAVSLRGFSDRWTHGLGALAHDERVIAMTVSWWLVAVGFVALRRLPQPSLGFYGATRRLEEISTRRLALGGTLVVAIVGFAAGVLPGAVPT